MNINEKAMLFVYQREWKNWCSYVVILISHCILKSGVMPENLLSLFLLAGIATIILLPCYHLCFAAYVGCYRYAAYMFFFVCLFVCLFVCFLCSGLFDEPTSSYTATKIMTCYSHSL